MAASRSAGREASARPGLEQQTGEEGAAEREAQIEQEDLALHEREDGEGGGQRGDAAGEQEGEAGARRHALLDEAAEQRQRRGAIEVGRPADDGGGRSAERRGG